MASFTKPSNRMCRKHIVFHTWSFSKMIMPISRALQNKVDLCLNQDEWSRKSWVSPGKLEKQILEEWQNAFLLHAWFWQMQQLTYTFLYSIEACLIGNSQSGLYSTICNRLTIDYRATYVYGIGNGRAPLIVLHWAALKRSSEYIALAKINWKVTFCSHLSSSWTNCRAIHGEK